MTQLIAGPKPGPNSAKRSDPLSLQIAVAGFVLLILSSAIFFAPADLIDGPQGSFTNPLRPSYLYYFTYVITIYAILRLQAHPLPNGSKAILFWIAAITLLHIAWMPFVPENDLISRTLVLRLNDILMTWCFFVIFARLEGVVRVVRLATIVVVGTCLLNGAVVIVGDAIPIQMSVVPGRAAGLFWDPNQCATLLAMSLPLICYRQPPRRRYWYYMVVLTGILFTFSREGIILWFLAVLLDLVLKPGIHNVRSSAILRNAATTFVVMCIGFALLSAIFQVAFEFLTPYLNADTLARLQGTDQGSANERLELVHIGVALFSNAPIIGNGYGVTRLLPISLSLHNMYLLMMAEFGLVGLLVYLGFLFSLFTLRARFGLIVGLLYAVESVFTHSYFDNCYYSLLFVVYWRISLIDVNISAKRSHDERLIKSGQLRPNIRSLRPETFENNPQHA